MPNSLNGASKWIGAGVTLFLAFAALAFAQGVSANRLSNVEEKVRKLERIERIVIKIAAKLDVDTQDR